MNSFSPTILSISPPSRKSTYRKTTLPQGIRVVSEEIRHVRSISVGVWVEVGSRDEHERNNGISHFLEHMVFKGTKRYTSQQIARSLESVGGYLNAFTTKEHTCFYARILDEHLPKAIDVISDLVRFPRFERREIEKEKGVILEELKKLEDDPEDLIHDYFDDTIFREHPLAFPIIGRAQNIRSFSRDDLVAYIHSHYVPARIVVAAAGNLEHDRLVEHVERCFGRNRGTRRPPKRVSGPKHAKPKREVFERPILQAHVCTGTIGYGVRNPSRYPLLVMNTLLGEGMSSRLFQNIREKYGFAYSVFSFANLMSDTGNFGVYLGTDLNNIDNSLELIFRELEKLKSRPISKAELRRTKAQLKGIMVIGLESMTNRMTRLASNELYFGEFLTIDEILRSIDSVTVKDVWDLANRLFQFGTFSTVIIKPSSAHQPAVRASA